MQRSNLYATLVAVGIGGAVITGGCAVLLSFAPDNSDPAKAALQDGQTRVLPNLVEGTVDAATTQIDQLGLIRVENRLGDHCWERDKCVVVRMSPKAGTSVAAGTEVKISYLANYERAWYRKHKTMTSYIGWTETKAQKAIEDAVDDLTMRKSAKVPVGQRLVIAQSPKPGTKLRAGQTVKVIVGYNEPSTSDSNHRDVDTDLDNGDNRESRFCRKRSWC